MSDCMQETPRWKAYVRDMDVESYVHMAEGTFFVKGISSAEGRKEYLQELFKLRRFLERERNKKMA